MAKYLVTGGAGFIGSNLVHNLIKSGHDVTVVDSLHTGSKNLISDLNVNFYQMRVDEYFHERMWKDFDGIFHLGKPSSTPMYKENREKINESVNGTVSVLEMAKEMNAKLVTASSSSLYNGLEPPHKESMIIQPTDFYTEARLIEERLAKVYEDLYGIKWNAMRFFSVYGPREEYKKNFANLISQFIWSFNRNERPVIYGDGSQKRDFIFIDDVVNALILAMKSNHNGIFNVGTGKSYSLNDVIKILKNKMGKDIEPRYIENPVKNYVMVTLADTSKSKKYLNFEAKMNIENGIENTINYYKGLNF
ncbi:MAG: NAD-dependent epimerase/dehydratase family protein [Thermoplasmata archaeon]|nr:NAD-dependent epimerase/dehydratase family protein [Thermoplasmata archaeon]